MGAGRPEWLAPFKKTRSSGVGSWLKWSGIWTAALGVFLIWNLQAADHQGRLAAVQAATAAIEQNGSWRRLAAEYRLFVTRPGKGTGAEVLPILLDRATPPESGLIAVNLDALLCQLRSFRVRGAEGDKSVQVRLMSVSSLNGPERQALANLRRTGGEETAITERQGGESLHLLRPESLEEKCHLCHQPPGDTDLFGIVKASLPLQPFLALARAERRRILFLHMFLWLAGVGFLGARTARDWHVYRRLGQTVDELQGLREWREQFDNCPDGLCISRENLIRYANRQLPAMLGLSVAEMTASPLTSFLPASELAGFTAGIGRLVDGDGEVRFDSALLHRDGTRLEVEVLARNTIFEGRKACFLILRGIGRRKEQEEATEAARALLQSILDGMAESVRAFDADYRLLLMNKTARQLYGDDLGAIRAPCCLQLIQGEEDRHLEKDQACPKKRVLENKKSRLTNYKYRAPNGRENTIEIMAAPMFDQHGEITGIIEVGRDIGPRLKGEEERQRMTEILCRREKEEAIATLVGGLAHDYNNILAIILGNGELLRLKMASGEEEPKLIDAICQAAKRMADLNRQLLASVRLSPMHLRALSLNPLVQEVLQLQRPPAAVRIDQNLAADLWPVWADGVQIQQLFTNLLGNAFEVLEESGGQITIATGNLRREKSCTCGDRQLPAGDYVQLLVSDSGPGVEREIGPKIFEPFFSTKFIGRGLGLAAAKGIVEEHGGAIAVANGRERGCTFEVTLPRAPRDPASESAAASQSPAILVVEDDPELMEVFKEALAGAGYRDVLVAGTGEKGLELLAERRQGLALLILDMRLPGISGQEVYRRVRTDIAGIRVLTVSGSAREEALSGLSIHPRDAFLQKPFVPAALIGEVERLLAS